MNWPRKLKRLFDSSTLIEAQRVHAVMTGRMYRGSGMVRSDNQRTEQFFMDSMPCSLIALMAKKADM